MSLHEIYGNNDPTVVPGFSMTDLHRSLIQYLSKLQTYPDGTAVAKALADYWRVRHNNRPAMKDELRKAGF